MHRSASRSSHASEERPSACCMETDVCIRLWTDFWHVGGRPMSSHCCYHTVTEKHQGKWHGSTQVRHQIVPANPSSSAGGSMGASIAAGLKACMDLWSTEASGCTLRCPLRIAARALVSCTSGCTAPLDVGDAGFCRNGQTIKEKIRQGEHINLLTRVTAQAAALQSSVMASAA